MKHTHLLPLTCFVFLVAFSSCSKKETTGKNGPNLPSSPFDYATNAGAAPANMLGGITPGDNTPSGNKLTNAGATLGRVLFYDKTLSANGTMSCASCHKQQNAFADNTSLSTGFGGDKTTRNTPGLFNEHLKSAFFWDGRANGLENQVLMDFTNHAEMGIQNLQQVAGKIQNVEYYPALFKAAFGSSDISEERISNALAQFVRSMVSFNARLDQGPGANFSPQELHGKELFEQMKCNKCHAGSNADLGVLASNGSDWANIGLPGGVSDAGRMSATGKPGDDGAFRVPSLRNVALTAPYMHDGRFSTLMDVLNHYDHGITAKYNLDSRLTDAGSPVKMNMTEDDKLSLIAFLNTFTDNQFITDPKFSNPFK